MFTPESMLALATESEACYKALLKEHPPGTINRERNDAHDIAEKALVCADWLERSGRGALAYVGPFGDLPFKRGSRVRIRKGALVHSMRRGTESAESAKAAHVITVLEVEVDGATLQMDIDSGRNVLAQFVDMGIKVTAGGLGAAFGTLMNLVRSKVSALKVGEGLVGQVSSDDTSRVVMASVVGLGHGLGMEVIADGVHSKELLEAVRTMKCDSVQGAAVAQPMPIELVAGYL